MYMGYFVSPLAYNIIVVADRFSTYTTYSYIQLYVYYNCLTLFQFYILHNFMLGDIFIIVCSIIDVCVSFIVRASTLPNIISAPIIFSCILL